MTRWRFMQVFGPSMVPTLRSGDVVLVRHGGRAVRAGDVVVGMFWRLPGHVVVKRAVGATGGGWTLASDNAAAGSDSAVYGAADVFGRAVVRLRPGPGPLWWPSRVGPAPFGPGSPESHPSGTDDANLSGTDDANLSGTDDANLSGTDDVNLSGTDDVNLSGTDDVNL